MVEAIENKLQELYNIIIEKPNKVYEVFKDFYGEERVDMQGFSFETFKTWIATTPICNYIPYNTAINLFNFKGTLTDYSKSRIYFDINKKIENLSALDDLLHNTVISNVAFHYSEGFILVHFPKVRITNEYDKYVDITELYVKVEITTKGQIHGLFSLNRAEYSTLHLRNSYLHSHVQYIPFSNLSSFSRPCIGNGPIKNTISSLCLEFDEDLWNLFCFELNVFVRTESLAGGPYKKLENLSDFALIKQYNDFLIINRLLEHSPEIKDMIKHFTEYFIHSKSLKFNFINGNFSIGMTYTKYIILISNEFIKWYNIKFSKDNTSYPFSALKNLKVLRECIIKDGYIYYQDNSYVVDDVSKYQGEKICTFKDKEILLNISDLGNEQKEISSIILDTKICLYILHKILRTINYRYAPNTKNTTEEYSSQNRKKVRFI